MFSINLKDSWSAKGVSVITALVLVFGVFPAPLAFAATLPFSDGFESNNFSNWTSSDNDWSVTSGSGHSGSKKAEVSDQGVNDDILEKDISTAGFEDIVLTYYYKAGQPLESGDHVRAEYWNGSTWTELADHNSISNGSWSSIVTLNLPADADNLSSFKFRFRATGLEDDNGSGDKDEFQLDDVTLSGTTIIVVDTDEDGVEDADDACPNTFGTLANGCSPEDTEDACDDAIDNDGDSATDLNDSDCAQFVPAADGDDDGVEDDEDNCPEDYNPSQSNYDGDAYGNECDEDPFTDLAENIICGIYEDLGLLPLPAFCDDGNDNDPVDTDSDGIPDSEDACPNDSENVCNDGCDVDCDEECQEDCDEEQEQSEPSEPEETENPGSGGSTEPSSLCTDGLDNDDDGIIDWPLDPGCTYPYTNDETDPAPPVVESDGGTGGTTETGEIGETAEDNSGGSCSAALLTSYIGYGHDNPDDVKLLQTFLNNEMGSDLEVNGIYDAATKEVLMAFQLKYADEVLAPWASFGLAADEATGFVYKTTQRMINMLLCPGTEIPMPELP